MSRLCLIACAITCSLMGCKPSGQVEPSADPYEPQPYVIVNHPEWSKQAAIYQINTRQFSEAGTFAEVEQALPRIKALGTDIIWLMPVHPIGQVNRKGSLGSPYSVQDYYGVNPEFGTLDDLKSLINAAHAQGMYVILDWVANHTAWDNPLHEAHPEWYERNYRGEFTPTPWWDWSDIIDLDYSNPELRHYMTEAMVYWVREVGVDGFRADVAGFVPVDFWEQVRRELDAVKPVFMLAEWEARDLHRAAFDATYAWSWYQAIYDLVNGQGGIGGLFVYYSWRADSYPREAYRMVGVSNHDINAWEHPPFEAFGEALDAAVVLSVVGDGMPMIYNGQEAGNQKRLAFFEKDPIQWREHPMGELYRSLLALKKDNTALWNGQWGANMIRVWNSAADSVFAFVRENDEDKVFAVFNFSAEPQRFSFESGPFAGTYTEHFSQERIEIDPATEITLPAWGYKIYIR